MEDSKKPCVKTWADEEYENCFDSCASCGSYVMDNDKFCSNCGVSLKVAEKEIASYDALSKIAEKEIASFDTLSKIVKQLESCRFECQGGLLKKNCAFVALKQMAEKEDK